MIFAFFIFFLDCLFYEKTNIFFLKWTILWIRKYIALLNFSLNFWRNNIARKPFYSIIASKFILRIFWAFAFSFLIYIFNIYNLFKIMSIKYFKCTINIYSVAFLLLFASKKIESIYIFHNIVFKTQYFILLLIINIFLLLNIIRLLYENFKRMNFFYHNEIY